VRQIGTVATEREAKVFEDYLLAQGIKTKILTNRDGGWEVWVQEEDQVPRAAEEFRGFAAAPDDPRYLSARDAARQARRADAKAEREHRKNTRDIRERWEGPAWRRYPLTLGLIVASVAVSLLTNFGRDEFAGKDLDSLNKPTLVRRLQFSDFTVKFDLTPPFLRREGHGFDDIRRGQVWRLVTPIFLHFNVMHLLFNMSALRYFGGLIELRRGIWRLLVLVLVTAIASNIGEAFFELQSRDVVSFGGMSGVVYALFGYLWMKGVSRPDEGMGVNQNTVLIMVVWFVLCLTGAFGPIANAAHGVGLVVGMAFGLTRF
jgi:GlpG protein